MIEAELRTFLLNDAGVSTLAGDRVYPLALPQGVVFPALTYTRISGVFPVVHDGPQGMPFARIQVDCWGERYQDVVSLANAITAALNGYRGGMGAVTEVVTRVAGVLDGWEPEVQAFRRTVDIQVWYTEG